MQHQAVESLDIDQVPDLPRTYPLNPVTNAFSLEDLSVLRTACPTLRRIRFAPLVDVIPKAKFAVVVEFVEGEATRITIPDICSGEGPHAWADMARYLSSTFTPIDGFLIDHRIEVWFDPYTDETASSSDTLQSLTGHPHEDAMRQHFNALSIPFPFVEVGRHLQQCIDLLSRDPRIWSFSDVTGENRWNLRDVRQVFESRQLLGYRPITTFGCSVSVPFNLSDLEAILNIGQDHLEIMDFLNFPAPYCSPKELETLMLHYPDLEFHCEGNFSVRRLPWHDQRMEPRDDHVLS